MTRLALLFMLLVGCDCDDAVDAGCEDLPGRPPCCDSRIDAGAGDVDAGVCIP